MPSSDPRTIPFIIGELLALQPLTILDVGIGYGKWGVLAREYLDGWAGRVERSTWQIAVDGIEIWGPYAEAARQGGYYRNLFVGDAVEVLPTLDDYDVVLLGDVVEHLSRKDGERLLLAAKAKARRGLVASIPLGPGWLDNAVVGETPFEKHQAVWSRHDIQRLLGKPSGAIFLPSQRGEIGIFAWRNNGNGGE